MQFRVKCLATISCPCSIETSVFCNILKQKKREKALIATIHFHYFYSQMKFMLIFTCNQLFSWNEKT